eukprot:3142550-Pyramimonas_sp.AAC.1
MPGASGFAALSQPVAARGRLVGAPSPPRGCLLAARRRRVQLHNRACAQYLAPHGLHHMAGTT